jgi:hypothetical protein
VFLLAVPPDYFIEKYFLSSFNMSKRIVTMLASNRHVDTVVNTITGQFAP